MKIKIVYLLALLMCLSLNACRDTDDGLKKGTGQGDKVTAGLSISSPVIQEVSNTSAIVKGTILGENVEIEDRGICYSLNKTPTIDDFKISQNINVVNKTLTDLYEGTTYYVRLYAKIDGEYYYGKETSFTTKGERVSKVIFTPVQEISNLVNSRMEISAVLPNEMGYYGLCYGKTPQPKITDEFLEEANRNKNWVLPKLECGSEYYIRPFHIDGTNIVYYNESETKIVPLAKNQIQYKFEHSRLGAYTLTITLNNLPKATYEVLPIVWRWKDAYYQKTEGKNYDTPKKYVEMKENSVKVIFSGNITIPKSHGMYVEDYAYHLDGFSINPVNDESIRKIHISFTDENL